MKREPIGVAGSSTYSSIYAIVKRIPRGRVATYGQIASLAGLPGHARQVGYALHALPDEHSVPWHRVINSRGEISQRSEPTSNGLQRALLESEGVNFDERGRVDLQVYRWQSESSRRTKQREKEKRSTSNR